MAALDTTYNDPHRVDDAGDVLDTDGTDTHVKTLAGRDDKIFPHGVKEMGAGVDAPTEDDVTRVTASGGAPEDDDVTGMTAGDDAARGSDVTEMPAGGDTSTENNVSEIEADGDARDPDDGTDCPVCGSPYRDARLLSCGHHFCLACLQQVAAAHTEKLITCPTCRHVTSTDATELQRHKVTPAYVTRAAAFLAAIPKWAERACGYCEGAPAASTCFRCQLTFCVACDPRHEALEEVTGLHQVAPVSAGQFCPSHPTRLVACACRDCGEGCCPLCLTQHDGHQVDDVVTLACAAREEAADFLDTEGGVQEEEKLLGTVLEVKAVMGSSQQRLRQGVTDIRAAVKELETKIDAVEREATARVNAGCKEVDIVHFDLQEFINTKRSLLETLANQEAEDISDAEVALRHQKFPKYTSARFEDSLLCNTVDTPLLGNLDVIRDSLREITQLVRVAFCRKSLVARAEHGDPFTEPVLQNSMTLVCGSLGGMDVDRGEGHLVVRTGHKDTPVLVLDGPQIKVLWKLKLPGLESASLGVAVDSVRGRYILPDADGCVHILDRNGNTLKTVKVSKENTMRGVCCTDNSYVVCASTVNSSALYAIDAESYSVDILCSGEALDVPVDVCVTRGQQGGADRGLEGDTLLVVSNQAGNSVTIHDLLGRQVTSYGDHTFGGTGAARLAHPQGLCIDPAGRILLSDTGNRRVVALWSTEDEHFRSMLLKLPAVDARHLRCDLERRLLYVGSDDGHIHIYSA